MIVTCHIQTWSTLAEGIYCSRFNTRYPLLIRQGDGCIGIRLQQDHGVRQQSAAGFDDVENVG